MSNARLRRPLVAAMAVAATGLVAWAFLRAGSTPRTARASAPIAERADAAEGTRLEIAARPGTGASVPPRPTAEPAGLAALLRRLGYPDRAARGDALVRLRTLGPRAVSGARLILEVFREGDADLDHLAAYTLAALGPEALPALEDALQEQDPRLRAGALSTLARIETLWPRATDALRRGLADADPGVRAGALAGWAAHPAEAAEVAESLVSRLEDPSPKVRIAAAVALGKLTVNPEEAVTGLASLVARGTESASVRVEATWALARYGAAAAGGAEALAQAASEPGTVGEEALRALALLGPAASAAMPDLLRMADRTDEPARSRTLAALASIDPGAPEVTRRLAQCVRSGDPAAPAAVAGLVHAGEAGLTALRRASESADGTGVLAEVLVEVDDGPRGHTTRTALERLVTDASDPLALLALRSLASAGPRAVESVGPLCRALPSAGAARREALIDALTEVGVESPAAAEAVLAAGRAGDTALKASAARSLGRIGVANPDVAAFLETCAAASDERLASTARRARTRLGLDR